MKKVMGKGTVQLMVAQTVGIISGYALHFGLGRHLGPEMYGIIGVILSLLALNGVIFRAGVNRAVSKFIAENEELANSIKNKALKIVFVLATAVFTLYFLLAGLIADLLNDPALVPYIRLSAFQIPLLAVYVVYRSSLNGMRAFGKLSKTTVIYSLTRVSFVLGLVLLGYSVAGAIVGHIIAALVGMLVARYYCKFKDVKDDFEAKKMIRFAIPVLFFSLASTILISIDLLFVKTILKENALTGYYTSASTLSKPTLAIFTALSATLFPSIARAYGKNNEKLVINYITRSLRYLLILLLPITFLISATSENLISMVYTSRYIQGGPALSILVFAMGFLTMYAIMNTVIMAIGKPGVSMYIAFILIPIDVALNLTLIPIYQLEGAATATAITAFTGMLISAAYVFRRFKTLVSPLSLVRILIASLFIYIVSASYPLAGILLPLEYAFLFLVYLAILWISREIKREDVEVARGIFLH